VARRRSVPRAGDRRDRGGLGRTVEVHELGIGERAMGAAKRLGGDRRAAMADQLQRGDIARTDQLLLGQRREHGRDHERRRHPFRLDQIKRRSRIEHRQDDVAPRVPDGRQHRDRSGGVEQRRSHEPPHLGPKRDRRLEVERVRDQVTVGQHHALRGAGRPAGVEQAGDRVGRQFIGERRGLRAGKQGLVTISQVDDRVEHSVWTVHTLPCEQNLRPRVLECTGELGRGVTLIERHEQHPSPGHSLIELEVTVTVAADHRDTIAGPHTEPMERPHQPPCAVPNLTIGQLHLTTANRDLFRCDLHRALQRPNHRRHPHPFSGHCPQPDSRDNIAISPWRLLDVRVSGGRASRPGGQGRSRPSAPIAAAPARSR
jgi:hypothetical protein